MNWLIILIGVIAIFVVSKFIHFRHIKHRITAIVIILVVLFLYASVSGVVKTNDIDWKSPSGILSAGKIYLSWLVQAFDNIKVLTGNAIKMDWVPKNASLGG
jgi:hypothetical protein